MNFQNTLEFAQQLDREDKLAKYRDEFIFPKVNGKQVIYFEGNSLGLQHKSDQKYVDEVMEDWAELAVEGHFYADKPWWDYHERFTELFSVVVGANPAEFCSMNTLMVKLQFVTDSFDRSIANKFKILYEEKAFPSDQYFFQSQARHHGFHPNAVIVDIKRSKGEHDIRLED